MSWNHEGCFKDKECPVCHKLFTPFSGFHRFCTAQCKGKWKYITGITTTETQYNSISGNWKRYFQRLCCRSNKRENLSWEDCLNLLEQQNGVCALSGVELTCKLEKGVKCLTNASLDRIDAGGPYIKDNVQLVCAVLNSFRNNINPQEFIWWCKKVSEHNA